MKIAKHTDTIVYQMAFRAALEIFELTKSFPKEEKYSLTDQIRRSSRSICANLAEAFRKRRYPKAFIAKLSDSEREAAETQVWLEFSYKHNYICKSDFDRLNQDFDKIIGKIVVMSNQPEKWQV